ncbi:Leucine-rich repeat flightless-interacting protein 2 [Merluccius polli]|uniref:Leucine-rich repeat flightless-interacting protein 2 n=1 Tax=Merluccius polli TaxID=89951 RepID=A0AA47N8Q0_MERPO|nr:Leucine-rich repeat flightless-interacting protein 2 [Merluccius polli]
MAGRWLAGRGVRAVLGGRPQTPPVKGSRVSWDGTGASRWSVVMETDTGDTDPLAAAKRATVTDLTGARRGTEPKYYGLDTKSEDQGDNKWGNIEQWMEDNERYSRPSRTTMLSDEDERMSVGSRSSVRSSSHSHKKSKKKKKHKHKDRDDNGYDDGYSAISSRSSRLSDESRASRSSRLDLTSSRLSEDSRVSRGSRLDLQPGSRSSLYEDGLGSASWRVTGSSSRPSDYSSYRGSSSRASSRASSARASPVDNCGSVASFMRSASSSVLPKDLDDITIPDFSDVEDRDYSEKGSRAASALTAATLTSLGGTSSRRGSGETAVPVDNETSIREIKEIHELKDQIQDVESKYMQNLKEVKDALVEVGEKYRKAMVSNAQLDNEKNNLMYQVDTLKDSLTELEELLAESRREYEEKAKDIRQLNLKQDGFIREISDLQETVEWKDKKIGALERQKEYTDAIRGERDELRDEVVKLKDILKKHGIVLGPDLNINGDIVDPGTDGSSEPGSRLDPESQASPTEGNSSMLGSTLDSELRTKPEEEVDSDEPQEPQMLEEAKDGFLTSAEPRSLDSLPTTETSRDEDLTCLPKFEDSVEESAPCPELDVDNAIVLTNVQDSTTELNVVTTEQVDKSALNLHLDLENDGVITNVINIKDCAAEFNGAITEQGENAELAVASETEIVEVGDLQQTTSTEGMGNNQIIADISGTIVAEVMNVIAQTLIRDYHEDLVNNPNDIQSTTPTMSNVDESPQKEGHVVTNMKLENLPVESSPVVPITKSEPEPGNVEDNDNEELENEELSTKTQTKEATGKKKRKKRKGKKKKGGVQEEKQKEDVNEKSIPENENDTRKKDSKSSTKDDGSLLGSEIASSCPLEILKGSQTDQLQENQGKDNVLEPEIVEPQLCSSVSNAESNLDVSDPVVNSESINSTDDLDMVNTPCLASPSQESVLLAKASVSQIEPEITAVATDETGPINEVGSEHKTPNPTDSFEAPDSNNNGQTQDSTSVDVAIDSLHAENNSQCADNVEQSNTSALPVCLESTSGPQEPLETTLSTDQVTLGNDEGDVDNKCETPLGDTFQIKDSKDQTVGKEEGQTSSSCNVVSAVAHCDERELEAENDELHKVEETLDQTDHSAGMADSVLADKTCTEISVSSFPKEGIDLNSPVFEDKKDGTDLAVVIPSEAERIMEITEEVAEMISSTDQKHSDPGWAISEGLEHESDQSHGQEFDTPSYGVEDQDIKVSEIEAGETKSKEFAELHSIPDEKHNDSESAVTEELEHESDQSHGQEFDTPSYGVENQDNKVSEIEAGETKSKEFAEIHSIPDEKHNDSESAVTEELEHESDQSHGQEFDTPSYQAEDQDNKVSEIEEGETKSKEFAEIHSIPDEKHNDSESAVTEELEHKSDQSHCQEFGKDQENNVSKIEEGETKEIHSSPDEKPDDGGLAITEVLESGQSHQECETASYPVEDQDNEFSPNEEGITESTQVIQLGDDDDDDDDEDDEGHSFDFDEMDLTASVTLTTTSEEAEKVTGITPQDSSGDDSALGQCEAMEVRTEGEPLGNTEETATAEVNVGGDSLDPKGPTSSQEPQNTIGEEPHASKTADEAIDQLQSVVEETIGVADEQRNTLKEGEVEKSGGSGGVEFEMGKEALVSPIDEGQEVMKVGLQGGQLGVGNAEDPVSSRTASQQTKKTSNNGNKGKEIRLRKLVDEREKMIEQVKKLKAQLEQKTAQKNGTESSLGPSGEILENGTDPTLLELQRDANRQINDLKFKLVKAEQEVTALEQNVTRMEGQVTRYKSASENAEKVEDELKAEKRKLQRELRSALDKVDELESNNSHLSKRLDKMKSSRGTATP